MVVEVTSSSKAHVHHISSAHIAGTRQAVLLANADQLEGKDLIAHHGTKSLRRCQLRRLPSNLRGSLSVYFLSFPDVSREHTCLETSPQQPMATKIKKSKIRMRLGSSWDLEQMFKECNKEHKYHTSRGFLREEKIPRQKSENNLTFRNSRPWDIFGDRYDWTIGAQWK